LAQAQADVRADLVVTGDPQVLRSQSSGGTSVLVPARVASLVESSSGSRLILDARVLVFASDPAWRGLLPTQRLVGNGRLGPPRGGDLTAAVLVASGPPYLLKGPEWTQLAAGALRAGLQAACAALPTEPGGLLPGLVLGDTSDLDPALEEDFRTTGLTHLVAVSGANVAIVLGVVLLAARWLRVGPWPGAVLAGLALVGFVILVRPSPSVLRAAAMGAIGLLALATGRTRAAAAALAAAVVVALLLDPALASSVGFSLSVLATGALILLAPRWRDTLRAAGVPPGVAEALAVPAAAQVACAPVIAALSGQVSLIAVPANLLAAPAVAPATVLGVGSAVVSPFWPDGAGALAWLASWPARWLVWIAHTGAMVPVGSIPWAAGWAGAVLLAAVLGAVFVAAKHPVLRRVLLVVALAAVAGAAPVRWVASGWPPRGRWWLPAMSVRATRSCFRQATVAPSWSTPGPIRCRWTVACGGSVSAP
jgi:competence protein ComEC